MSEFKIEEEEEEEEAFKDIETLVSGVECPMCFMVTWWLPNEVPPVGCTCCGTAFAQPISKDN